MESRSSRRSGAAASASPPPAFPPRLLSCSSNALSRISSSLAAVLFTLASSPVAQSTTHPSRGNTSLTAIVPSRSVSSAIISRTAPGSTPPSLSPNAALEITPYVKLTMSSVTSIPPCFSSWELAAERSRWRKEESSSALRPRKESTRLALSRCTTAMRRSWRHRSP